MKSTHAAWFGKLFSGLTMMLLAPLLVACQTSSVAGQQPASTPVLSISPTTSFVSPTLSPMPALDRLAEPALPTNPTQLEIGRHLYWLNCMTCHGDRGQGLTDEFRRLYVEDSNCWARGCHAGHPGDLGFPIPRKVPAIIASTGGLPAFVNAQALFEYLRSTHPPQNPGFMSNDDYWALTAYLLAQNGRLPDGEWLGPK